MEKNNFEKQVQEKMAELTMLPSEKNWAGIERRIGKKDSRRKFLWFLLMGFFLLAGGGYLVLMNGKNDEKQIAHLPETKLSVQQKNETNLQKDLNKIALNSGRTKGTGQRDDNPQNQTHINKNKTILSGTKTQKKTSVISNHSDIEDDFLVLNKNLLSEIPTRSNKQGSENQENILIERSGNENEIKSEDKRIAAAKIKESQEKVSTDSLTDILNSDVNLLTQNTERDSSLQNSSDKIKETQFSDRSDVSKNSKPASIISRKWKAGFSFTLNKAFLGDGVDLGLKDQNFTSDLVASAPESFPGLNTSRPATGPPASPVNSIGFNAGIILQKEISSKTSFTTGLGYKYYSNAVLIGDQLPSGNYKSAGYLNSYRNNFHFIELPAIIQFRINKSRKFPLKLSTGFILSQLIASDAVQYKSGFYEVDNSLFNKTQFGFSAGFSATFFKKLSIGPMYNYGLNPLAKDGLYGKKHLNFLGIKADYIFQRNK